MKRRILFLAILAAVLCLCLVSCAPKPSKIYNTDYKETPVYDEITKIEQIGADSLSQIKGSIAVFKSLASYPVTTVFNVNTGKELCVFTDSASTAYEVELIQAPLANGAAVFLVTKTVSLSTVLEPTKEYALYDSEGDVLTECDGKVDKPSTVNDLVIFNNKAFRVDGDDASHAFDVSPLGASIPNCTYVSDDYNYAISSDKTSVRVYNGSYELVAFYEVPEYATASVIFVMNDQNVLIQYIVEQASDARSYDLIVEGEKYKLESLILKVKNGKTKNVNLKHLIENVSNEITDSEFSSKFAKVANCATIYEIEDKMIDHGNPKTVWMKKNGKVKKDLDVYINSQKGTLTLVADDRFVATNKQGQSFLLNGKGENLGEITKAVSAEALKDGYILMGDKIYDYDLALVLDISEQSYSLVGAAKSYVILKKPSETLYGVDEYYIYSKGTGLEKLDISWTHSVVEVTNEYFVTASDSGTYDYYNSVGADISEENIQYTRLATCTDAILLYANGKYYRLK